MRENVTCKNAVIYHFSMTLNCIKMYKTNYNWLIKRMSGKTKLMPTSINFLSLYEKKNRNRQLWYSIKTIWMKIVRFAKETLMLQAFLFNLFWLYQLQRFLILLISTRGTRNDRTTIIKWWWWIEISDTFALL